MLQITRVFQGLLVSAVALASIAAFTPAVADDSMAVSMSASTKLPITPETVLAVRPQEMPSGLTWLAGTNLLLLSVANDQQPGANGKEWIEEVDSQTGARKLLVQGTRPQGSPSGQQIAYISNGQLWVIGPDGSGPTQLTHADSPIQSGNDSGINGWEWSPDGKSIGFISDGQLWEAGADGSGAKQLTQGQTGIDSHLWRWSPDSAHIAFVSDLPQASLSQSSAPASTASSAPSDLTVTITNHGSGPASADTHEPNQEIQVVDVATGASKVVTSVSGAYQGLFWTSDGNTLLVSLNHAGSGAEPKDRWLRVQSINLATGARSEAAIPVDAEPMFDTPSPDGNSLAETYSDFHGLPGDVYWETPQIALFSADGYQHVLLPTPYKTSPLCWSPNGKFMYIRRHYGACIQIVRMGLNGKTIGTPISLGGEFAFTNGDTTRYPVVVSSDNRLAWLETDYQARTFLATAGPDGADEHVLTDFSHNLDAYAFGDTSHYYWTNHKGAKCSGILIKPVGYQAGHRYPLLVGLHGGPISGMHTEDTIAEAGPLEYQMWANKGYVVFLPEYESSGDDGVDGIARFMHERETGDVFDDDLDDIMSGVNSLIAAGLVDPDKMAVGGHSNGSTETNWVITHTHCFKAAVSYEGFADMYADFGVGLRTGPAQWLLKGTPTTAPSAYMRNSAIYFARGATTPTLFINCDGGINSPSMPRMYTSFKEQGVDTQFLLYKGEGHVASKPDNVRDILYWTINWIDTHLGYPPTLDPKGIFQLTDVQSTAIKPENSGNSVTASTG